MKIAILTQPLGHNYGGLLQAYALNKYLLDNGFCPIFIDMPNVKTPLTKLKWLLGAFKRLFFYYILKRRIIHIDAYYESLTVSKILYHNLEQFKKDNLTMTDIVLPKSNISQQLDKSIFAYIVGSDQIWRPMYSPYQPHYFLDFVRERQDIKRIAYAASFGVDVNEFSDDLLDICKPLAQKFDAISVREDSGIRLCKELFDVEAVHVLDPTMLLDAEHYTKLSNERNDFKNDGDLFTYVLDETSEKQNIIDVIAKTTNLKPFRVLPKSKFRFVGPKHIEDCVLPPVEQWLRAFVDAKYVVTDSFHGTIFSILFKRTFITIGNSSRGMARFTSLLKMFNLEDRIVFKPEDVSEELINKPIDYDKVYRILEVEREKSKQFLIDALGF